MITEIHEVITEMFNDNTPNIIVSECTADVCKLFAKYINKEETMYEFDELLFRIFEKHEDNIKSVHWTFVKMKSLSSAAIPYKMLWDLFELEQKKHA